MFNKTKDESSEPIVLKADETGMPHTVAIIRALQKFPIEFREAFDAEVSRSFMTEMPVIAEIAKRGLEADRADFRPLAAVFNDAINFTKTSKVPGIKLPETLNDVGSRIAEEIDSGVKRILLQATKVDRRAMRELLYCHARLLAAMEQLAKHAEKQSGL